jgi:hypothetical protein
VTPLSCRTPNEIDQTTKSSPIDSPVKTRRSREGTPDEWDFVGSPDQHESDFGEVGVVSYNKLSPLKIQFSSPHLCIIL